MNNSSAAQSEGLVRAIGTRALGLNIINMVVGGGIFVLPGLIAAQLGSAAIVAYLICSLLRVEAVEALAEIGGEPAMRYLNQALEHQDNAVRKAANEALAELSSQDL